MDAYLTTPQCETRTPRREAAETALIQKEWPNLGMAAGYGDVLCTALVKKGAPGTSKVARPWVLPLMPP